MVRQLQQLFSNASRRRLRICAGFAVACWLLLNAQLAVSSHHSDTQIISEHHSLTDTDNLCHLAEVDSATFKLLCQKHCQPDSAHTPSLSLQLDALPAEEILLLIPQQDSIADRDADWRAPPVTGPPAEIRFCRFRE
ncbi:hypothetical protein [Erwinia sp. V71]|uniref:hypothetical protein n=1 Tax=Erwinia sp. V71 TaxID=3369424 RepID=UPI003F600341